MWAQNGSGEYARCVWVDLGGGGQTISEDGGGRLEAGRPGGPGCILCSNVERNDEQANARKRPARVNPSDVP
jgi:hypothetical protein